MRLYSSVLFVYFTLRLVDPLCGAAPSRSDAPTWLTDYRAARAAARAAGKPVFVVFRCEH